MRIYQMSATFGKLEHQTLMLKPGLNIITAPNEWGKSTWCAFLSAMLYGIDTRSKTTKLALADKERYAPWSGAPMEGRIDLCWQGRDITIERRTRGRIPMGDFSAYETKTGITVPQLTAANCGQLLLGVEQSVFRRSCFIRHGDLPVTQDEALRRRLNALVTTGDESAAADRLGESLKELRNKIRYHRTGLLPQAETDRDELEAAIAELDTLEEQQKSCQTRMAQLQEQSIQLRNHLQALKYGVSVENANRLNAAKASLDQAQLTLQSMQSACAGLPPAEKIRQDMAQLQEIQQALLILEKESLLLPPEPKAPVPPEPFGDMSIAAAKKMVHTDAQDYVAAKRTTLPVLLILMGIVGFAAACVLIWLKVYPFALASGSGSLAALIWGIYEKASMKKQVLQLQKKYGTKDHSRWALPLIQYDKQYQQYVAQAKQYREASGDIQIRLNRLNDRMDALCGQEDWDTAARRLTDALDTHEALAAAQTEAARAQAHYDDLRAAVRPVQSPAFPDTLTLSEPETRQQLDSCAQELHRLQNLLGQHQGRMEALGKREPLQRALERKRMDIHRLENTYAALVIAQETLSRAKEELQRRFAPRITARAQELMQAMTGGRYTQLIMDAEFSLQAATDREDTLRDALWRSDGTMDQLYLCLRLAVAQELTPEAPLVLDDALVRFDDTRLSAAIRILEAIAMEKQILLFTCQGREQLA